VLPCRNYSTSGLRCQGALGALVGDATGEVGTVSSWVPPLIDASIFEEMRPTALSTSQK